MESEDTAISSTQIGLGIELWATIHILRESKDPMFDPSAPLSLPHDEVEELLGISKENQDRIINKALNIAKSLNENML